MSRYARVPIEVAADRRLTLIQTRVLIALLSHQNKSGQSVFPKRNALSEITGYTPSKVSNATSDLERLGWLRKVVNRGRRNCNEYEITVPELGTISGAEVDEKNMPESGTNSEGEKVPESENVPDPGTVPELGTPKVPDPGTPKVPESGTPLKKEEQPIEQPIEQPSTAKGLIGVFAVLGFEVLKVHTPEVMGMLRQWEEQGVTPDDVRALVEAKRRQQPDKTITSPMYFKGAMNDYLEAKRHEPAETASQPGRSGGRKTRREHHADISAAADRLHAEALAEELGDGAVPPIRGVVSG